LLELREGVEPMSTDDTNGPHCCLPSLGEPCGSCHRCSDTTLGDDLRACIRTPNECAADGVRLNSDAWIGPLADRADALTAALREAREDRDAVALTAERMTSYARQFEAEVERLHTWDGLISLLNEHWPEDIFPTEPDCDDRDSGVRLLSAVRRADRAEGRLNDTQRTLEATIDERDQLRDKVEDSAQSLGMAEWRLRERTRQRDDLLTKVEAVRALAEDARRTGKRLSALAVCDALDALREDHPAPLPGASSAQEAQEAQGDPGGDSGRENGAGGIWTLPAELQPAARSLGPTVIVAAALNAAAREEGILAKLRAVTGDHGAYLAALEQTVLITQMGGLCGETDPELDLGPCVRIDQHDVHRDADGTTWTRTEVPS
jgi:hypothetical protein